MRLRTIAAMATLAIVLVACASAESTISGQPSSESSAVASSASEAPVLPSLAGGAVADLEAWIPDTVAGVPMHKVSMRGDDSFVEFDADVIGTLLQDLGVTASEVSLAVGIGYSASGDFTARVFVFRAAGVDSDRLAAGFKKATDSSRDAPLVWTATSIDGKQVETSPDGPATNYLYIDGDVLVLLVPSNADVAAEVIRGLP